MWNSHVEPLIFSGLHTQWLHMPQPSPDSVPQPPPDVIPAPGPDSDPGIPPEIIEPPRPDEASPVGEPIR